jgi:hypothetical protein
MPEASAETWLGLAQACADRAGTTDAGFQEEALAACERALQVFTETNHLALWSQTHSILAAVYSDRLTGDRESNLQQSIAHRAATLRFYQFERNPLHWAITHLELGAAYRNLRGPGYTDNQRRAADHCRQALRVFTRAQQPRDWAAAHGHLAAIAVDGPGPDAATTALAHLAAAAQVITRETAPADWAVLQFNEAEAYRRLNRGDRLDNLRQAVSRYPHALLTPGVTRPSRDQVLSQFSIAVTDLAREAQRRRDRAALVWCADLIRAVQRQLSPGPPGDATRLRYLQNQLDQMLAVLPAAP